MFCLEDGEERGVDAVIRLVEWVGILGDYDIWGGTHDGRSSHFKSLSDDNWRTMEGDPTENPRARKEVPPAVAWRQHHPLMKD